MISREMLIKEDFCSLSMLSLSVRLEDSPNGYRGKEGEFRAKRSVSRHTIDAVVIRNRSQSFANG